MKRNIRLIPVILAAGVILASCTKEPVLEQSGSLPQEEGSRVIAVSFASQPATKTALGGEDGLTPEFVGGESVLVSNDETTQECRVTFSGERATITTRLQGDLTAVYPVIAAKYIPSEKTGEKIIDPDNVLISAKQSGTFADANICMATMKDGEEKMTFHNKTAILKFYVDNSIGVYNLKVKSSDGEIADNSQEITVESKAGSLYEDMPDNQDRRICYVAVKFGVDAGTLSFISHTTTQGCVRKSSPATGVTLEVGTMYNAFIPYYVEVGGQKWAYCNIGAFLPEEAGEYFAWGEVKGHKPDLSISPESDGRIRGAFTGDFNAFDHSDARYTGTYNPSSGFTSCNTPYYNGKYWHKYSGSPGEKLLPEDDAANVNWGNGWRIPTKAELDALKNISNEVVSDYRSSGKSGRVFTDSDKITVFWPFTGYGYSLELRDAFSNNDYYWSTTPYVGNSNAIYYSDFGNTKDLQTQPRFEGLNIRPIYDEPAPVPNVFTVNEEGKRIEFTKGNLYWNGSDWALEANQYDYRTWKGSPACIGGTKTDAAEETGTSLLFWTINPADSYLDRYNGSTSGKESIPFFHESSNFTVGEQQGLYALSQSEWDCLLNRRTTLDRSASKIGNKDDARFMWCSISVNNDEKVPGLMIFPDYFIWPTGDGAPDQPEVSKINNGGFGPVNEFPDYTNTQFQLLENQGVVFLPLYGFRTYYATHSVNLTFNLNYWSSTADEGKKAFSLLYSYSMGGLRPAVSVDRNNGYAIRLVKNYSASNN